MRDLDLLKKTHMCFIPVVSDVVRDRLDNGTRTDNIYCCVIKDNHFELKPISDYNKLEDYYIYYELVNTEKRRTIYETKEERSERIINKVKKEESESEFKFNSDGIFSRNKTLKDDKVILEDCLSKFKTRKSKNIPGGVTCEISKEFLDYVKNELKLSYSDIQRIFGYSISYIKDRERLMY